MERRIHAERANMKGWPLAILMFVLCSALDVCVVTAQTGPTRAEVQAAIDSWSSRANTREAIVKMGGDAVPVLVSIAIDEQDSIQSIARRRRAIWLLGTFRTDESIRGLTRIADCKEPMYRCEALRALAEIDLPPIVRALIRKLDDHDVCMRFVSTHQPEEFGVYVSDVAVNVLEDATHLSFEKKPPPEAPCHRATEPWKRWWAKQQKSRSNPSR